MEQEPKQGPEIFATMEDEPKQGPEIFATMEDEPKQGPIIFGKDISQIPCFRNSFLYGIGGGIGIGTLAFLSTSRPRLATHIGFGSFCIGTMSYWMVCRYQWSKKRFEYQQLKSAMKKQVLYEGTDAENPILKEA